MRTQKASRVKLNTKQVYNKQILLGSALKGALLTLDSGHHDDEQKGEHVETETSSVNK
jgi:hypothetical protein